MAKTSFNRTSPRARSVFLLDTTMASLVTLWAGCGDGENTGTTGATSGRSSSGESSSSGKGGSAGGGGVAGSGGAGGSVACGPNEKLCGGACVLVDDPQHGCDPSTCDPCALPNASPVCVNGACDVGACSPDFENCDADPKTGCEVNTETDPAQCGGCGSACVTPNGAPSCVAGSCAVGSCSAPFVDCDGDATNGCESDPKFDPENCGACGAPCAAGESCEAGVCGVFCPPGKANCDGDALNGCETDLGTTSNCGFCGDACSLANASATCAPGGTCAIDACDAGFEDCDVNAANGCETDTQGSALDCGSCGNACPSGPSGAAICASGACALVCDAGFADCDGLPLDGCEVSTSTVTDCGSCGNTCPTPAQSTAVCSGGACGFVCSAPFADCNSGAADGCETNTAIDPQSCGACGLACSIANGAASCAGGSCAVASCAAGFADCDGLAGDGCEINTDGDPTNCGACGAACSIANGQPACSGGVCAVASCDAGFDDCNTSPGDGCEINTNVSVGDCGGCGITCSIANGAPACSGGACAVASCNLGFANCNNNPADGCEINTTNSASSCGVCGNVCPGVANGAPGCSASVCGVGGCDAGFANCNGQAIDGCEVNTTNNANNCGACGNQCGMVCVGNVAATTCQSSACGVSACNAGYFNVDGLCSGGCECQASTVSNQCSAPISLGAAIGIGQSASTSANLVPAGQEAWYIATFTGNTNPAYHPHVVLTTNPGSAFLFDIRTSCAGAAISCGVEGGASNAVTDGETFKPASNGYTNVIPLVGNNGTILIHVFRKAGAPLTCDQFTLKVSN